jgi:hypothetical protein
MRATLDVYALNVLAPMDGVCGANETNWAEMITKSDQKQD